MKKYKWFFLIMCLVTAVSGCGKKQDTDVDKEIETHARSGEHATKEKEELVTEVISESGEVMGEDGYPVLYEYTVPNITEDSEGARSINESIQKDAMEKADAAMEQIRQGLVPDRWTYIGYRTYWSDSLLSIVLTVDNEYLNGTSYIYCYDAKTGERVTNEGIIQRLGVTEEEFMEAAKRSAMQAFDQSQQNIPRTPGNAEFYYSDILAFRAATYQNMDFQQIKLYISDEQCKMISEYFFPAGGGSYHDVCDVDLNWKNSQVQQKVTDSFITAELKNNQVYLTFEDTQEARECIYKEEYDLPLYDFQFGTAYQAESLYSDYTGIHIENFSEYGYDPYLILEKEDGFCEFIDIIEGAQTGRFYGVPVIGKEDTDEYHMIDCILRSEQTIPTQMTQGTVYYSEPVEHPVDGGNSYTTIYGLQFHPSGGMECQEYTEDGDFLTTMEGFYSYLGTGEEGMEYAFSLSSGQGEDYKTGVMTICEKDTQEQDAWIYFDSFMLRIEEGVELFDRPDAWTIFTENSPEAVNTVALQPEDVPKDHFYYNKITDTLLEIGQFSSDGQYYVSVTSPDGDSIWYGTCASWEIYGSNGLKMIFYGIYEREGETLELIWTDNMTTQYTLVFTTSQDASRIDGEYIYQQ